MDFKLAVVSYTGMKNNIHKIWLAISSLFLCKLCWRITIGVFCAILIVEAAILFFSVSNYKRDRLAEMEREALVVMRAIGNVADNQGGLAEQIPIIGPQLSEQSVLLGAVLFDLDKKLVASFGEIPTSYDRSISDTNLKHLDLSDDSMLMDIQWEAGMVIPDFIVSARIDTSELKDQITGFIWRIAGLILLISAFVTVVTMVILEKSLLSPIRHLGDRLHEASEDPNNPSKYIVKAKHEDEWGDVLQAFNQMLGQSGLNLSKIKQQETELIAHRDSLEKLVHQRTAKLEIALERAEAASRSKSAFLSNMRHELRTPLNAMIGFSDLQRQQVFGPLGHENYIDYANEIHDSSQGLLNLLNTLLEVTNLESGESELQETRFDICAVLQLLIKNVEEAAKQGQVEVNLRFPDSPLVLLGDEARIRQLFANVVSNAVKFSNQGDRVTIKVQDEGERGLCIEVIDTGVGMRKEDLAGAVEQFGQIETSYAREHGGAGLGLTLAKLIADLHQGSMKLESEYGKGTTVTVRFPQERVSIFECPENNVEVI